MTIAVKEMTPMHASSFSVDHAAEHRYDRDYLCTIVAWQCCVVCIMGPVVLLHVAVVGCESSGESHGSEGCVRVYHKSHLVVVVYVVLYSMHIGDGCRRYPSHSYAPP